MFGKNICCLWLSEKFKNVKMVSGHFLSKCFLWNIFLRQRLYFSQYYYCGFQMPQWKFILLSKWKWIFIFFYFFVASGLGGNGRENSLFFCILMIAFWHSETCLFAELWWMKTSIKDEVFLVKFFVPLDIFLISY
jgi:hypothetical protein